jgi:hypothetical protein
MADSDDLSFSLIMPFVCVTSNGGVLEGHSFVCGANYGAHAAKIRADHPIEWGSYVSPDMIAQYDLLAMSEGYVMTVEPWDEHPEEWVLVTFAMAEGR